MLIAIAVRVLHGHHTLQALPTLRQMADYYCHQV